MRGYDQHFAQLVDIGCGTGAMTALLARRGGRFPSYATVDRGRFRPPTRSSPA
jgi:trans-aconitate methyltransferase